MTPRKSYQQRSNELRDLTIHETADQNPAGRIGGSGTFLALFELPVPVLVTVPSLQIDYSNPTILTITTMTRRDESTRHIYVSNL